MNSLLKGVSDPVTGWNSLNFTTCLVSSVDRRENFSMATRFEECVPFLDDETIGLARSLPVGYRQARRHVAGRGTQVAGYSGVPSSALSVDLWPRECNV